jgi:hypothetical protein
VHLRETASPLTTLILLACAVAAAGEENGLPRDPENGASAAGQPPLPAGVTQRVRRIVRAAHVAAGPVVDGRLEDPAWAQAGDGGPLVQYFPVEGAEPSEPTAFRFVYDRDTLYLGVWCYDSEPERIIGREMARDGAIFSDDYLYFVFDTFLDRRNGYVFAVNPNGARVDGLIANNSSPSYRWDGIWRCKTRVTTTGWTVEVALPFKTFSFNPQLTRWGFNLMRMIKRTGERQRWNAPTNQLKTYYLAEAGLLTGLEGLRQGLGIEITPYALGKWKHDNDGREDDVSGDGGGEIKYRITPNLQAILSYNTDFAETEVDLRQVNLTRFPLFFPEKRGFFLEDAGIFEFGDLGTELIPFFSRRIGISTEGEPVPIVAAGKLTGRIGNYNVGVIDALVDDHDGLGEKNAFVTRISRNIYEQSSVGMIATAGDPNSDDDNFMGGVDYSYRTSDFLGDHILEWNTFALASSTENVSTDDYYAFGSELVLPNDTYYARAQFYQIEEDFNAALGFVPRRGIRAYEGYLSYRPRPEAVDGIRQLYFTYRTDHVTDLNNRLDTAYHYLTPLFVRFESDDEVFWSVGGQFDSPDEEFEISDGVIIPSGRYWWHYHRLGFETASKRPIAADFVYRVGDFYEGTRDGYSLDVDLKPVKHLFFSLGYDLNKVRLPQGDFETRLGRIRTQLNFTPDLIWYHLLQYDNVSDTVGYNSRVVWEFQPGARIFLVLNQGYDRQHSTLRLEESMLTVKLSASFRF